MAMLLLDRRDRLRRLEGVISMPCVLTVGAGKARTQPGIVPGR
ncbi:hypothetical protein [Methylibium sp.]